MSSIKKEMEELKRQLEKGSIQKAYQALLSYMMGLRTHFMNTLAGTSVSALYQGSMDITFFTLAPSSLGVAYLKVPIVFNYKTFGFEAWLAGAIPGPAAVLGTVQGRPMAQLPRCRTGKR